MLAKATFCNKSITTIIKIITIVTTIPITTIVTGEIANKWPELLTCLFAKIRNTETQNSVNVVAFVMLWLHICFSR